MVVHALPYLVLACFLHRIAYSCKPWVGYQMATSTKVPGLPIDCLWPRGNVSNIPPTQRLVVVVAMVAVAVWLAWCGGCLHGQLRRRCCSGGRWSSRYSVRLIKGIVFRSHAGANSSRGRRE